MKQGRLDQLADGIFAIVMTLLVFEIRVPEFAGVITDSQLLQAVINLYPLFLSYVLSFSLLFTYWRSHHYIASVLAKNIDIPLSNLSALFFVFVGLVPFSSHLLGVYNYTEVAIIIFAINIILIGLSLYIMRRYVINAHDIENSPYTPIENAHANVRIMLPVVAAIFAVGVSFYHKDLALTLFTLAIIFNLSRRSTRMIFWLVDPLRKAREDTMVD